MKPFNMYKQCLTLNNIISRYYILEKEYCKALFLVMLLVTLEIQLKLSEKKKISTRITLYDYTIQLLFLKKTYKMSYFLWKKRSLNKKTL